MCPVRIQIMVLGRTCYFFPFQAPRCENQIEKVCKEIDKTINQTIQHTLNKLEKDCIVVDEKIERILDEDR